MSCDAFWGTIVPYITNDNFVLGYRYIHVLSSQNEIVIGSECLRVLMVEK